MKEPGIKSWTSRSSLPTRLMRVKTSRVTPPGWSRNRRSAPRAARLVILQFHQFQALGLQERLQQLGNLGDDFFSIRHPAVSSLYFEKFL